MIVRLKGVKKVRARGRIYYYHRRTRQRIKAAYGTEAFALEVMHLNAQPTRATPGPEDGTLEGLITAYRASPEFLALADRTKHDYQKIIDYLKPLGDLALSRLTSKGVIDIRRQGIQKTQTTVRQLCRAGPEHPLCLGKATGLGRY